MTWRQKNYCDMGTGKLLQQADSSYVETICLKDHDHYTDAFVYRDMQIHDFVKHCLLLLSVIMVFSLSVTFAEDSTWEPKTIPDIPAVNGVKVSISSIKKRKRIIDARTTLSEQNLDVVQIYASIQLDAGVEKIIAKALLVDEKGRKYPGKIIFDGKPIISHSSKDHNVTYLPSGDVSLSVSKEKGYSENVVILFDVQKSTKVSAVEIAGLRFDFDSKNLPLTARKWTDVEGRQIDAILIRVDGDKVIMKIGTKEFQIAISRLSAVDKKFLEEWKALNVPPSSKTADTPVHMICGKAIQANGEIFSVETSLPRKTRKNIIESLAKYPQLHKQVTDTLKIGIALPKNFNPKNPQRVLWVGINNRARNDTVDRHVKAMSYFVKAAVDKGWIVLAVDTKIPLPEGSGSAGSDALSRNQIAINMDAINILSKEWQDFKNWQFVCCGADGGGDAAQLVSVAIENSKINVTGMLFFGKCYPRYNEIKRVTNFDINEYRKIKVYVSRPTSPRIQGAKNPGDPIIDPGSEESWKVYHERVNFEFWDYNDNFNTEGLEKALTWIME